MFAQQPEASFARLISVVSRTAGDDKAAARTRLLELFELFDPAEPIVIAARRKLLPLSTDVWTGSRYSV